MRRIISFVTCFALLSAAVVLTGCAAKKSTSSGFLGDSSVYRRLSPHPTLAGVKVSRTSNAPLRDYDSFIIPPVKIYLSEQGQSRDISRSELSELAQFFRNEVHGSLKDRYRITKTSGPRTAILRLAITDADPNIALMNVHPGSLLTGGGLGGASAEFELVDSVTGQPVVRATASSKGKRYKYASGLSKWGHTKGVLSDWASIIRKRVDEDHGFKG